VGPADAALRADVFAAAATGFARGLRRGLAPSLPRIHEGCSSRGLCPGKPLRDCNHELDAVLVDLGKASKRRPDPERVAAGERDDTEEPGPYCDADRGPEHSERPGPTPRAAPFTCDEPRRAGHDRLAPLPSAAGATHAQRDSVSEEGHSACWLIGKPLLCGAAGRMTGPWPCGRICFGNTNLWFRLDECNRSVGLTRGPPQRIARQPAALCEPRPRRLKLPSPALLDAARELLDVTLRLGRLVLDRVQDLSPARRAQPRPLVQVRRAPPVLAEDARPEVGDRHAGRVPLPQLAAAARLSGGAARLTRHRSRSCRRGGWRP